MPSTATTTRLTAGHVCVGVLGPPRPCSRPSRCRCRRPSRSRRISEDSVQVGAMPRCTWATSSGGSRTRTAPSTTSSTCVARSATARKMFSLRRLADARDVDRCEDRDRDQAADDVARVVGQRGPERAQVVRHEEGRDRDREDVVERQRPARQERDDLVEGVAGEARGAPGLREHRGALGIGLRGQREQPAGEHEHHRREPERVGGDEPERVVDRRADVAVGGGEERADPHARG